MLGFRSASEICLKDYRKYADTAAVLAALKHLFDQHPELGQFIGVEHDLVDASGKKLTPDLVTTYESKSRGLVFELKWSISSRDEIAGLKKYAQHLSNWRTPTGKVKDQDVILVCHWEDTKSAVDMIKQLVSSGQNGFFNSDGFAVWSWTITKSRENDLERMYLVHVWGKSRNRELQRLIQEPGGIPISEDVLTYLRFTYTFIRQKATRPIHYDIANSKCSLFA